jgi:hypothetical protein
MGDPDSVPDPGVFMTKNGILELEKYIIFDKKLRFD